MRNRISNTVIIKIAAHNLEITVIQYCFHPPRVMKVMCCQTKKVKRTYTKQDECGHGWQVKYVGWKTFASSYVIGDTTYACNNWATWVGKDMPLPWDVPWNRQYWPRYYCWPSALPSIYDDGTFGVLVSCMESWRMRIWRSLLLVNNGWYVLVPMALVLKQACRGK